MGELENKNLNEAVKTGSEEDLFNELSELEEMFAKDLERLDSEEVSISEDLTGFANGFPNWDVCPPKNLRHKRK